MYAKTWKTTVLALTAVGVLAAGCAEDDGGSGGGGGETAAGSPTAQSADPASQEVDLAALDTGTWPTEPAPRFGSATKDDITKIDGQRMAEFVVAPYEIDPVLTSPQSGPRVVESPRRMVDYLSGDAVKILMDESYLYGFMSPAKEPQPNLRQADRSLINGAWRFPDPETAKRAATLLHEKALSGTGGEPATAVDPATMPGTGPHMAGALVSRGKGSSMYGDPVATQSFTPHGDYVLYQCAEAPRGQEAWTAETVSKAVAAQGPWIDRFPQTPTKSQTGGAKPTFPVIDQDKLLIYAVPTPPGDDPGGDDKAVYGPRGMAHRSSGPAMVEKALTDTGSEHNAVARTTVHRTGDDAGAQTLLDTLTRADAGDGWTPSPAPKGLPTARCLAKDDEDGHHETCYVVQGRYVGHAEGTDKREVDQLTSAQYVILTKADQRA